MSFLSMVNAVAAKCVQDAKSSSSEGNSQNNNTGSVSGNNSSLTAKDVSDAASTIFSAIKNNSTEESYNTSLFSFSSDNDVIDRDTFSSRIYDLTGGDENQYDREIGILYDVMDWDDEEGISKTELLSVFDVDEDGVAVGFEHSKGGDGKVTVSEFLNGLEQVNETDINQWLDEIDAAEGETDKSGKRVPKLLTTFENPGNNAEEANPDAFESDDVITYREEVQRQVLSDYLDDYTLAGFTASYSDDGVCCLSKTNDDGSRDFYRVVQDGDTVKIINTHRGSDGNSVTSVSGVDIDYAAEVIKSTNAKRDRAAAYQEAHTQHSGVYFNNYATDTTDYAAKMAESTSWAEFSHWAQQRVNQAEAQGIDIMGGSSFIRTNDSIYEEWRKTHSEEATLSSFVSDWGTSEKGYYGMDASGDWGYYEDAAMTKKLDNGCWNKTSDGGPCNFIKNGDTKLPNGKVQDMSRAGQKVTMVSVGVVYEVQYNSSGYPEQVITHSGSTVRQYDYNSNGYVSGMTTLRDVKPLNAKALQQTLPNASTGNNEAGVSSRELTYVQQGVTYTGPGAAGVTTGRSHAATPEEYLEVMALRENGIEI